MARRTSSFKLQHAQLPHVQISPLRLCRRQRKRKTTATSSPLLQLMRDWRGARFSYHVNDPTFPPFSPAAAATCHRPSRPSHTHSTALSTIQLRISRRIKWASHPESQSPQATLQSPEKPYIIHMSSEYGGNFSSFNRGYGGGRGRPDLGNRYYIRGGRGRGGGSGSSGTALSFPPETDIKKDLDTSKAIETVPSPPRPSAVEDIPIENVQYVSSYNWVDKEQPTIVVPGAGSPPFLPS
jgi:hypothetical protein